MHLLTGCNPATPPILEDPPVLFCDVEEPRRFTQRELDWRAVNAAANLRRDFKTNTTWDRECSIPKTNEIVHGAPIKPTHAVPATTQGE